MSSEAKEMEVMGSDRAFHAEHNAEKQNFPCFYEQKFNNQESINSFEHQKVKEFSRWRGRSSPDEDKLKDSENATTLDQKPERQLCFLCEEVLHEGECPIKHRQLKIPHISKQLQFDVQPIPSSENPPQSFPKQIPKQKINSENFTSFRRPRRSYSKIKPRDERQQTLIHSVFCSFCYTLSDQSYGGKFLKLLFKVLLLPYALLLLCSFVLIVLVWLECLLIFVPVIGWCYWSCFYIWNRESSWGILLLLIFFPVTYPIGLVLGFQHECEKNGLFQEIVRPLTLKLLREMKYTFYW